MSYSTSKCFAWNDQSLRLDYAEKGVLLNGLSRVIETALTKNVLGEDGVKKMLESIPQDVSVN